MINMLKKTFCALAAFCATFAVFAADPVAKVGNTEYATIDEAIAKWGNGSTLTLLADVTLSDVVTFKSTEHHILNLGTFTMTAASGKHAIEITCEGRSSASYALTVNADAANPGGITATGKSCIYYKKSGSTKDRPIILINNGVFTGSYSLNLTSNGNTNCPQIWINNGVFNSYVNLTKCMLRVSGGVFHAAINCTGDSSAYREIKGGRFKSWQFMTADAANKFWVGSGNGNYNVGVYVDKEGYLVVGGPVITEVSLKYPAVASNYSKWSSYLKYSAAAANGLFYEDASMAIAKHGEANVDVFKLPDGLENNKAVDDFEVQLPNEVKELKVELSNVDGENKVVYNVEPKAESGEKVSNPASAIKFRLALPSEWTGFAKVFHAGADMGLYQIMSEDDFNYVEIESASFSEFAIELASETVVNDAFGDNTVFDGTTYYKTMKEALEGIHLTGKTALYCKPGASVGEMTHGHVCSSLTVYGNGAYVAGGEQDFEVDTYKNCHGTARPCNGLTGNLALTIKNLKGAGVWGQRTTTHTIDIVLENCEDIARVYINGMTGVNNIALKGCTATSDQGGACKLYSNANGNITVEDCTFANLKEAINLNHKVAGEQTVTVKGCSFDGVGNSTANYAAPVRVLSSVDGAKSALTVENCTFANTVANSIGQNADILLDYGVGEATASVTGTAANVAVEKTNNNATTTTTTADGAAAEFTNVITVAQIGDVKYATLQDAIAAVQVGETIQLLAGTIEEGSILFPAVLKNITIKGAADKQTVVKNTTFGSFHGGSVHYEGITIDGIVFDGSQIVFTGARTGEVVYKDWTISNCEFRNIVSASNSAIHFNLAADETLDGLTFATNVIDGVTGGNISGLRANYLSGDIVIVGNRISNVAWNAIQLIHANVGTYTIENNVLASGAAEGILNLYNTTATTLSIANNQFLVTEGQAGIGYLGSGDVSANYWGGEAPANLPEGVTFVNYYTTVAEDGTLGGLMTCVAKIGNKSYTNLVDAFKAATEGCTIEILEDVTIDYNWDDRYTGSKFTVPVTIEGNGKTIKVSGLLSDPNGPFFFKFEADATVKNLTIDISEVANNKAVAISSKADLTVDGCAFIGNATARGVRFGEGAGTAIGEVDVTITNSSFTNFARGITDNENGQDAKTVVVTGNRIENANVNLSAIKSVSFTGNTVTSGYVDIRSYTANDTLNVTATGNTLTPNTEAKYNNIKAGGTINAQDDFVQPPRGNNSPAYTAKVDGNVRIYGEAYNLYAKQSVVFELYAGETKIATTTLNNIGNIINGKISALTWNFYWPESDDAYWTTVWEAGHPNSAAKPTSVKLIVDGVLVDTDDAQMNGPDNLNPVVWRKLGGVAVADLEGEGTEAAPYLINNLTELKWFRDDVNAGNTYASKVVKLTADIDLGNEEWTPIAYMGKTFKGTFDGNGKTIKNLKITKELANAAANNGIGFFGRTDDSAVIKNLTIENVDITGSLYVGAVVGYGYTGKAVENCTVKGNITIDAWWYAGVIGGNGYMNTIKDCHVVGNDGSYIKGNDGSYIGGIWGFRGEGANNIVGCSVKNLEVIGVDRVGGIAGIGHYGNTVSDCSVDTVTITATDPNATTVGLIVGACQGTASAPSVFENNTVDATVARVDNGDGTFKNVAGIYGTNINGSIPVTNFEASINGIPYITLKAAVEAVEDNGTITLLGNVTITEATRTHNSGNWYDGIYYVGDTSFTIDFAGFIVTQDGSVNDYLLNFKNDGSKANTITLKNGTIDAGTAAYCAICTSSASTQKITINTENINIVNNISNGSTVKIRGEAEFNAKAGTKITGKNSYLGIECVGSTVNIYDGAEIYMNGTSSYNGCLVGVGFGGVVNAYGGYGKGVKGGFIAMTSGGTINISGGEWIANNDGTVGNNSNLYVLTAQNNKYESGYVGASVINVTGGTFRGGMDAWVLNDTTVEKAELNIAGGNFNKNPDRFVVSGYVASEADGIYTVAKAVVKVAEAYYATLQAAVNAAQDGETINLLEDITGADVTIDKAITLDLGGKTVNDAYIKIASDVKVQNGAIKNVNQSYPLVVNSGTLTIENVAIEASKSDRAIWLRNSGTTLNFNSGSILATKGENNSNSKIYGVYVSQGATANINGGTITVDAGENATAVAIFGNYVNTVNVTGGKISTSGKNYSYAIWTEGKATVTGGEIVTNEKRYGYSSGITYGYNYAIYTKGNVEITGGKITTNGFNGHLVYAAGSNQEVAISGVEFSNVLTEADKTVGGHSAPSLINGSNVTAEITGGEFNGVSSALVKGSGSALAVSGGMFDVEIKDEYIVPGFQLTQNADGAYSVVVNPAYGKVAKIGETYYETLQAAVNAAQEGDTVQLLAVEISEGTVKLPATLKNVTIKGTEGTVLKDMTVSAADGNSYSYIGLTFDGITFDNSRLLFTGWRNGEETIEDLTIVNCVFRNLYDDTNTAAVHINKDAAEAVKNFTFTNNVIDGATGGSKSGIYLQATGDVIVEDNVINNVSFRPYVIQITTDDGIADNFVVSGNTFSGSAVGRAQGLGSNAAGTDSVVLNVNNNIFKDITDAQQICYWNFNATTTTADLSNNYYDIDIVANPGKIYYNSAAADTVDLIEKGVYPYYTELNADGSINVDSLVQAPAIVAQIGNTKYLTFSAAVSAAQEGDTITLLADIELADTVTITKSITVEGNGKKVIPADESKTYNSAFMVGDSVWGDDHGETIAINNVKFEGWKTNYGVVRAQGVTLNMDGCEFSDNSVMNAAYAVLSCNYTDALVTNTKFLGNNERAIDINYNADGSKAVVTIDGCEFVENRTTGAGIIYKNAGNLMVKNSIFDRNTVCTDGNAAIVYAGWGTGAEITGCIFKDNTVVTSHATSKRFASAVFCDGCVVNENAFIGNTATRNGETIATIVAVGAYYGAADISANYWGKAEPEAGVDFTVEYTRQNVAFDSYYASIDEDGTLVDLVAFVAKIGDVKFTSIDDALAAAKDADTVVLLADATIQNEYAVEDMSLTIAGDAKLTFDDKLKVKGESSLNISAQITDSVQLLDGTILKDSTINGTVFVAGNVLFRGANTVKMVYDYGVLTDYYGTSAPMCWTVEPGASLVITDKARYGLGYGDQVTIKGSISDAKSSRSELTDADASLVMHGLVAQESKGWNKDSSLTVNSAYVRIGDNNSFGNKPGNYGGAYQFKFVNSVLDASRITFYEALSTTEFLFKDSDVKMGTFMTRDADSVFTLDDTVLLSTATSNGSDEGNYHAGKLVLSNNSRLTYSAEWKVEATGVVEMDATCSITAPMISGTGKIVIDARTVADIEKQVIFADMTGFTGAIEVVGGDTYQIVDTGVIIRRPTAYAYFDGYYYDTFKDAFNAAVESGMSKVLIGVLGDSTVGTMEIPAGKSIVLDLGGKTLAKADGAKIVVDNAIVKFANGTLSGFSASDVEIKGDSVATFPANTVDLADFAGSFYKTTNEDGSVSVATKFRSFIQVESGVPCIGFLKNATSEYKVYGKAELTDADWELLEMDSAEDVVSSNPALPLKWFAPVDNTFRFFKVEMVEEN